MSSSTPLSLAKLSKLVIVKVEEIPAVVTVNPSPFARLVEAQVWSGNADKSTPFGILFKNENENSIGFVEESIIEIKNVCSSEVTRCKEDNLNVKGTSSLNKEVENDLDSIVAVDSFEEFEIQVLDPMRKDAFRG